jgi:hypothetical protein
MGDVSHIMPAIEAQANGCSGTGHGADYAIRDPYTAYVAPAKAAAMTIVDLLHDDARGAEAVLEDYEPAMTKESYLAYMREMAEERTWNPET